MICLSFSPPRNFEVISAMDKLVWGSLSIYIDGHLHVNVLMLLKRRNLNGDKQLEFFFIIIIDNVVISWANST